MFVLWMNAQSGDLLHADHAFVAGLVGNTWRPRDIADDVKPGEIGAYLIQIV